MYSTHTHTHTESLKGRDKLEGVAVYSEAI
jgi:hypothetical protein